MTANELADKLENNTVSWGDCTHEQHDNDKYFKEQAATMLRQQAKEIQALHNLVKEREKKIIDLAFDLEYARRTDKFRELTDEEITEEIEKMFGKIIDPEVLEDELTLARAILQKAREK